MPGPEIEPRPPAWQAVVLTTTVPQEPSKSYALTHSATAPHHSTDKRCLTVFMFDSESDLKNFETDFVSWWQLVPGSCQIKCIIHCHWDLSDWHSSASGSALALDSGALLESWRPIIQCEVSTGVNSRFLVPSRFLFLKTCPAFLSWKKCALCALLSVRLELRRLGNQIPVLGKANSLTLQTFSVLPVC